jgi:hypothetical protein
VAVSSVMTVAWRHVAAPVSAALTGATRLWTGGRERQVPGSRAIGSAWIRTSGCWATCLWERSCGMPRCCAGVMPTWRRLHTTGTTRRCA